MNATYLTCIACPPRPHQQLLVMWSPTAGQLLVGASYVPGIRMPTPATPTIGQYSNLILELPIRELELTVSK